MSSIQLSPIDINMLVMWQANKVKLLSERLSNDNGTIEELLAATQRLVDLVNTLALAAKTAESQPEMAEPAEEKAA